MSDADEARIVGSLVKASTEQVRKKPINFILYHKIIQYILACAFEPKFIGSRCSFENAQT